MKRGSPTSGGIEKQEGEERPVKKLSSYALKGVDNEEEESNQGDTATPAPTPSSVPLTTATATPALNGVRTCSHHLHLALPLLTRTHTSIPTGYRSSATSSSLAETRFS